MDSIIERLRKYVNDFPVDKLAVEALVELERQEACYEAELRYATRLATFIWEKHWRAAAPGWKPLPDLMGVLTQIDNGAANLVKASGLPDDR